MLHFEDYLNHLKIINGKEITPREIDILACILSGKAAKRISVFLDISPRTMETHMLNIRRKLGCTSHTSVIDFLEDSGKESILKKHYQNLRIEHSFRRGLKEIAQLLRKQDINFSLLYTSDSLPLFETLKACFELIGIHLKIKKEENKTYTYSEHIIYALNNQLLSELGTSQSGNNNNSKDSIILEKKPVFILYEEIQKPELLENIEYIDFRNSGDFYPNFFQLLKNLLTHLDIDPIIHTFMKEYKAILSDEIIIKEPDKPNNDPTSKSPRISKISISNFFKPKHIQTLLFALLLLICLGALSSIINSTLRNSREDKKTALSDLIIPESNFLKRSDLINLMKQKLNKQEGIK